MTTRPTDEEIKAMSELACLNMAVSTKDQNWIALALKAWLSERQAAMDGVAINELDKKDVHKACESDYTVVCPEEWMAEAIKSIAPPIDQRQEVNVIIEGIGTCTLSMHNGDVVMPAITVQDIFHREQSQRQEVTEADAHFYWRYVDGSSLPEGYDLPRGLTAGVPDSTCRQRAEHYGATIEVLRSIKWTLGDSPKSIPDATSLGRWLALHLRSEYPNVSNRIPEFCWIVETLLAAQSIAPPIKSVSDALNFLEEWALAGNKLHGDDIQRFHATVERIAPVAKTVKVPEEKEDLDPVKLHRQGRFATEFERGFNEGWNDCREAMLSAAPAYNGKKEG